MDVTLQRLVGLGHDLFTVKYFYIAGVAVLFYDVLLTLSDEIDLIWRPKKTYLSYLSIFHRYFSCGVSVFIIYAGSRPHLTSQTGRCHNEAIVQLVSAGVVLAIAQVFMMLRVYAMSGRKTYIMYGLSVWIVVQSVFSVSLMVLTGTSEPVVSLLQLIPIDVYRICVFDAGHPRLTYAYMYTMFAYDTVIFAATLVYAFKVSRSSSSGIMRAVLRDGTLCFFFLFSFNLMWVLSFHYGRIGLKTITIGPAVPLTSVMIARINFSLHKANKKDQPIRFSTSDESYTLTEFPSSTTF